MRAHALRSASIDRVLIGVAVSVVAISIMAGAAPLQARPYVSATVATLAAMLLGGWEAALLTEVATLFGTIWFELPPSHTWVITGDQRPLFWLYLTFLAAANILFARTEVARHRALRDAQLREQILATNPSSIITFDLRGTVLYANQAAFDLVGVRTGDRIGIDFDSARWARRTLDGQEIPPNQTPFRRVLAEGRPIADWQYRLRPSDGKWRVVTTSAAPILDPRGRVSRVVATTTDITERHAAEERLRAQHEMLDLIMRCVPGAVFQWEPGPEGSAGTYRYVTERMLDILSIPADPAAAALNIRDHLIPTDRERVRRIVEHAVATRTGWDLECTARRDDGTLVRIHSLASPAQLPDDRWVWNGIFLDVTRQRRLEAELQQAQKVEGLGHLAGGIAHDFNNMLTAIIGYADLLVRDLPPETRKAHDDVAQIRDAAERASWLTRQLLAFTRQGVVAPRHIDVGTAIADMDRLLRRVIGEAYALVFVPSTEPCVVYADPGHLQQIVLNLVVNARDAMPDGGSIVIAVERRRARDGADHARDDVPHGDHIVLRVSDAGVGIPPELLPVIFDPFFTTKEAGKGTGIGLATVRSIVEAMRGELRVTSDVGRGTTFSIFLPVATDGVVTRAASPPVAPPRPAVRRTILLAEDDPHVRAVARRVLVDAGYVVLETEHASDALSLMAQEVRDVALVIADIVMPGMSGGRLVEHLRRARPGLGAVFISGFAPDADMAMASGSGLDADARRTRFLAKPFTGAQLLEAADAVLSAGVAPSPLAMGADRAAAEGASAS